MVFRLLFFVGFCAYCAYAIGVCPDGTNPNPCFARPCDVTSCPRFPNARCVDDFCGGCNAIFIDEATGTVIPQSACVPIIECSRIRQPNMRYRCNNRNYIGSRCTLSCRDGYELIGTKSTQCTASGYLPSPRRNRCVRVECPRIRQPNMRYRCSHGNYIGSRCTLSCRDGYELIGTKSTQCTASGYSPSPRRNRCVRVKCYRPKVRRMQYKCSDGNDFGSTCKLSCKGKKYRLQGHKSTQCGYDGYYPDPSKNRCRRRRGRGK